MDYTCYIIIGFPITYEEVSELRELAEENLELENGIYIAKIVIDGPARGLNLREGDIILKIDDYELNKMNDLKRYIYQKSLHDVV